MRQRTRHVPDRFAASAFLRRCDDFRQNGICTMSSTRIARPHPRVEKCRLIAEDPVTDRAGRRQEFIGGVSA